VGEKFRNGDDDQKKQRHRYEEKEKMATHEE